MKKCPYCGSTYLMYKNNNKMISCNDCGKLFPEDGSHRDTVNELIGDLLDTPEWEEFVNTADEFFNQHEAYDRAMKGIQ